MAEKMLTIKETAAILNISQTTVMTSLAELGAVNVGKRNAKRRTLRIPESAIDRYLAGREVLPELPMHRRAQRKVFADGEFHVPRQKD